MAAFTTLICERQTRLHFSHGEVVGDSNTVQVTDFRKRKVQARKRIESCGSADPIDVVLGDKNDGVSILTPEAEGGGHGGGDLGLIRAFTDAVRTRDQGELGVDMDDILRSHLTVFAAEMSRHEGRVVDVVEFENDVKQRYGDGIF